MFLLKIECSKDIETLNINFSDGTSVITTKEKENEKSNSSISANKKINTEKPKRKQLEKYLDTSSDFSVNQDVVEKPKIDDLVRPPKVTDELQNLDF